MWKDIKVTLYDIFGYFLPGAVILSGFSLCWKALWQLISRLPATERWVVIVLSSYYLGHVAQGLGNGLEWLIGNPKDIILGKPSRFEGWLPIRQFLIGKNCWRPVGNSFLKAARSQVKQGLLETAEDGEVDELLYPYCTEVITQHGHGDQREMYEYREGFYRGSAIAFVLVALALVTRFVLSVANCPWSIALAAVSSLLAAFVSFRRYGRFSESRVRSTLLGSLVVGKPVGEEGVKDGDGN